MSVLADGDLLFQLTQVHSACTPFILVVAALVHLSLALAGVMDIDESRTRRRRVFLDGKLLWYCVVLLTELLGVTAHWVFHHSTLRRDDSGARRA